MIKRNLLKRCATLLLAGGMIFGFTACGNHGGEDNGSDSGGSVQSGNEYEGTKKDKFTGDGKLIVEYFGVDMDTLQSRSDDTQLIMDTIENKFQVSFKIMNRSAAASCPTFSSTTGMNRPIRAGWKKCTCSIIRGCWTIIPISKRRSNVSPRTE